MCIEKPSNLNEYRKWFKDVHNVDISRKTRNHYNAVALKVLNDFTACRFWKVLASNMQNYNEEYLVKTSYPLFAGPAAVPPLQTKEFNSFLLKTFRNNVLRNKNWPNPPENGWIVPPDWLSQGNDIVRTCFVVKYLDGVEFLIEALASLADDIGLKCWKYYVAGDDGYYAAHVYIRQEYEVPGVEFDTEYIDMTVELQITSQLQEVIRKLLHKHFEIRRERLDKPEVEWQWDYKSDEFATNYLGHILHYVEGMIMEVRDRGKNKTGR